MDSEKGDPFRSTVASDVMEGGQVLIPAGAEIDGTWWMSRAATWADMVPCG